MEARRRAVTIDSPTHEASLRLSMTQNGQESLRACAMRGRTRLASEKDCRLIEALTHHEVRYLNCLSGGISNKDIARDLGVSENTVKFHLKNVYSKLAVRTRHEALSTAYELGVLTRVLPLDPN
ncbi:MAG: LuxR C-terminal-related transcriptional regulator [Pseudomonadota bacterium]|nr:LuxR C-terminal-related transcriptional regulator [Pseudomonadota bacterium]